MECLSLIVLRPAVAAPAASAIASPRSGPECRLPLPTSGWSEWRRPRTSSSWSAAGAPSQAAPRGLSERYGIRAFVRSPTLRIAQVVVSDRKPRGSPPVMSRDGEVELLMAPITSPSRGGEGEG
eukprot:755734-Hanusia_phi.AAC.2